MNSPSFPASSSRRILVTGGSRGIGLSVVRRLLSSDAARVTVVSDDAPESYPDDLRSASNLRALRFDFASAEAPGQAVRDAVEWMGGLDGLVHCAGIYPEANPQGRSPAELWELTMNVKARAGYLLALEFSRLAEPGSSFVAITSINAEQSEPDHLAYDPACAALGGVVRAFAIHFAPRLRFNAVAPGLIRTRLTESVFQDPAIHQHIRLNIPMDRAGDPDDCAGAILFLLGADSAYITGETIFVDGGIRANQMSRVASAPMTFSSSPLNSLEDTR
jgi:NAD(P)-dependent dehydrogenase (short-subunit alcohol dehydrogenase family)